MIQVRGLTKTFPTDPRRWMDPISPYFKGNTRGLLGPNGAGSKNGPATLNDKPTEGGHRINTRI